MAAATKQTRPVELEVQEGIKAMVMAHSPGREKRGDEHTSVTKITSQRPQASYHVDEGK